MEWFRVPEKIYFKRGCLPIALRELKEVYDRKRAVVLVDDDGFRNGIAKPVTDQLNQMHIFYTLIAVENSKKSVPTVLDAVKKFQPDCLIAVGDKAISAGNIVRILCENPELTVEELSKRVNLRDRTLKPLKTGKVYFIAVAASDCTGYEVSPISIGELPNFASNVQDYAFLPDMCIIDTNIIQKEDIQVIANMSAFAIFCAMKVFVYQYISDYTKGLAVHAVRLILDYFPKYQENPADLYALEHLSNAAEMASMAFSNVYDGIPSLEINWNPVADALGIPLEKLKNRFSEIRQIAFPESE